MHRWIPMLPLAWLVALAAGCTAPVGGSSTALSPDGGPTLDVTAALDLDEPPHSIADVTDPAVTCTVGYPLFLCDGGCPSRQLCCVTGVRPTGVCRTLDGCADQCASDCGYVGMTSGERARLICEAFCVAVTPDVACERRM